MATGTVTVYHDEHGYGSIRPDDGSPEVTVYYDSIVGDDGRVPTAEPGRHLLPVGQRVSYQPLEEEGRLVAEQVRLL